MKKLLYLLLVSLMALDVVSCNKDFNDSSTVPENKVKFQNILFPAGVSFSKDSGFNRTAEANSAIEIFHLFSDSYREFQETKKEKPEDFSFSVDSTDTLSNFIDGLLKLLEIP